MEKLEIKIKDAEQIVRDMPYNLSVDTKTEGIKELSDKPYKGGTSIRYWM